MSWTAASALLLRQAGFPFDLLEAALVLGTLEELAGVEGRRRSCMPPPASYVTGRIGAIAGRDMNLARTIAADQQVDADARWLQASSAPGTLDQLRVEMFLARLSGQPLHCLLPQPPAGGGAGNGTAEGGAGTASAGAVGAGPRNGPVPAALGGSAAAAGFPAPGLIPEGPSARLSLAAA